MKIHVAGLMTVLGTPSRIVRTDAGLNLIVVAGDGTQQPVLLDNLKPGQEIVFEYDPLEAASAPAPETASAPSQTPPPQTPSSDTTTAGTNAAPASDGARSTTIVNKPRPRLSLPTNLAVNAKNEFQAEGKAKAEQPVNSDPAKATKPADAPSSAPKTYSYDGFISELEETADGATFMLQRKGKRPLPVIAEDVIGAKLTTRFVEGDAIAVTGVFEKVPGGEDRFRIATAEIPAGAIA